MEAEYIAASIAAKEALWLQGILQFLLPHLSFGPVPIHMDNQSAQERASTVAINQRTKHIDVRYHALRDFVLEKCIVLIDTDT